MKHRTLIRAGDGVRIYQWDAMPPEMPVPCYSVHTTTPGEYGTFPTLKQAIEWADRNKCPLLQAIPFSP